MTKGQDRLNNSSTKIPATEQTKALKMAGPESTDETAAGDDLPTKAVPASALQKKVARVDDEVEALTNRVRTVENELRIHPRTADGGRTWTRIQAVEAGLRDLREHSRIGDAVNQHLEEYADFVSDVNRRFSSMDDRIDYVDEAIQHAHTRLAQAGDSQPSGKTRLGKTSGRKGGTHGDDTPAASQQDIARLQEQIDQLRDRDTEPASRRRRPSEDPEPDSDPQATATVCKNPCVTQNYYACCHGGQRQSQRTIHSCGHHVEQERKAERSARDSVPPVQQTIDANSVLSNKSASHVPNAPQRDPQHNKNQHTSLGQRNKSSISKQQNGGAGTSRGAYRTEAGTLDNEIVISDETDEAVAPAAFDAASEEENSEADISKVDQTKAGNRQRKASSTPKTFRRPALPRAKPSPAAKESKLKPVEELEEEEDVVPNLNPMTRAENEMEWNALNRKSSWAIQDKSKPAPYDFNMAVAALAAAGSEGRTRAKLVQQNGGIGASASRQGSVAATDNGAAPPKKRGRGKAAVTDVPQTKKAKKGKKGPGELPIVLLLLFCIASDLMLTCYQQPLPRLPNFPTLKNRKTCRHKVLRRNSSKISRIKIRMACKRQRLLLHQARSRRSSVRSNKATSSVLQKLQAVLLQRQTRQLRMARTWVVCAGRVVERAQTETCLLLTNKL